MANGFIEDSITKSIDNIINGEHSYFKQAKYDIFTMYKVVFTEVVNTDGMLFHIDVYIVDDKRKGVAVNLLLLNRYSNIPSNIILRLVKTYQHNGVWDGGKFIVSGNIKRDK